MREGFDVGRRGRTTHLFVEALYTRVIQFLVAGRGILLDCYLRFSAPHTPVPPCCSIYACSTYAPPNADPRLPLPITTSKVSRPTTTRERRTGCRG